MWPCFVVGPFKEPEELLEELLEELPEEAWRASYCAAVMANSSKVEAEAEEEVVEVEAEEEEEGGEEEPRFAIRFRSALDIFRFLSLGFTTLTCAPNLTGALFNDTMLFLFEFGTFLPSASLPPPPPPPPPLLLLLLRVPSNLNRCFSRSDVIFAPWADRLCRMKSGAACPFFMASTSNTVMEGRKVFICVRKS